MVLLRKQSPIPLNGIFRKIWSYFIFSHFCFAIYLFMKLWQSFFDNPTLITFEYKLSTADVAFPAITICNPNAISILKLQNFVNQLVIPRDVYRVEIMKGLELMRSFSEFTYEPSKDQKIYEIADRVLELNKLSIYQVAVETSSGCSNFLHKCFWGHDEFNCNQKQNYLSFNVSISSLGTCCSFNYQPNNDSYLPFTTNNFGINSGLTLIGNDGSSSFDSSTGLILFVHHPKDFVSERTVRTSILRGTETFVEIFPTERTVSEAVLDLKIGQRACFIAKDVDLMYRRAQCLLACKSELVFKTCGCVPYNFPTFNKLQKLNECKLKDVRCYSFNRDAFINPKCTHCLPNCFDVTYDQSRYHVKLFAHNHSISDFYDNINKTRSNFVLHAFLARQNFPSSRTIVVQSWWSFMADVGGAFSLCMGISFISIIEFFYFFTYCYKKNIRSQKAIITVIVRN